VPPDGCATGFAHEDAGCVAVLPGAPCEPGSYALVGERACRTLGVPAAGKWGDIAVESDTQHVDASFGGTSTGSAAAPWKTIQSAVAAATDGAIVAVAAGTYSENLVIDRTLTLWGIGAAAVSIEGGTGAAIRIDAGAVEVRGVAVTGMSGLSIGSDAALREVRVHDCAGHGIDVGAGGSVSMEASLVEGVVEYGIAAPGGDVTVVDSVVRDVAPSATGEWGAGLLAWSALMDKQTVVVRRSIIERTHTFGISVQDAVDTVVEDTLVRDVEVRPADGEHGIGIYQWWADTSSSRASLTVSGSVLEHLHAHGVVSWGGDTAIERITVRDIAAPDTMDEWGAGIGIMSIDEADRTSGVGSVRQSTVDDAHRIGIELWGSQAELERVLVRRPRMKSDGLHGFGVFASSQLVSGLTSRLTLRGARIEEAHQGGLTVMGSTGTADALAVLNTQPNGMGAMGVGVAVITSYITGDTASADMTHVVVDGAHAGGIVVGGGDLIVSDALVRSIHKQPNVDDFGDGIGAAASIVWLPGYIPTTLSLTRATIEGVPRAGVSNFGASISIRDTLLECNAIDLDGEVFEDEPFRFDNQGNNDCGCGESRVDCKVLTTNIQPPLSL
jgi:hypothetical protein